MSSSRRNVTTRRSPRPRRPPEAREQQLLDAAARLFREQGFAGTGLREIAKQAGMLLGSLQYRFPSKEALLVRLMERAVARAMDAVRAAVDSTPDPMERMRRALGAHLRALLSGDDAVYVLLYDWRVLRGDARDAVIRLRDRYEAFWDGILYEAAGAGRFRPGLDIRMLRLVGFGAINWVATWYRPEGPTSPEEIADVIFTTMALGILSDDARATFVEHHPASQRSAAPRPTMSSRRGTDRHNG